jgi:hypothetical protein
VRAARRRSPQPAARVPSPRTLATPFWRRWAARRLGV